jgi:hypothetical protein
LELQNEKWRTEKERYLGNVYQLGGTRHYSLTSGHSNGCRCTDVKTGGGLEYTVVSDRGMDISLASFRGINLVYLTADAEANPAFYDSRENEWLRTFSAGLLTTCGPSYLGNPCDDRGERLGLHGRFSALSASNVCDLSCYDTGVLQLTGQLYDGYVFGDKLQIKRTITSCYGENKIFVEDTVKNVGGRPAPITLLYHVNFGFPFLDEQTLIHIPSTKCEPADAYTAKHMQERFHMASPDGTHMERNYTHTFGNEETVTAWVWNKRLLDGIAVYLKFSPEDLPFMTQWMLEDHKDYVAALEPANVPCLSRDLLREQNMLPQLQPGEQRHFRLEIGVVSGNAIIEEMMKN